MLHMLSRVYGEADLSFVIEFRKVHGHGHGAFLLFDGSSRW